MVILRTRSRIPRLVQTSWFRRKSRSIGSPYVACYKVFGKLESQVADGKLNLVNQRTRIRDQERGSDRLKRFMREKSTHNVHTPSH